MRTTVTLEDDVAAAVDRLRRERSLGVSAAVNELVRRGLVSATPRPRFVQETSAGEPLIDLTNIGDVLDLIEGPASR